MTDLSRLDGRDRRQTYQQPRGLKAVKAMMLITDLGFIVYWTITITHLLPEQSLFKDYHDDRIVAWNWSFLPLDLLISGTGLTALWLARRDRRSWWPAMLISLTLTSCSGLQAIAFWAIRGDFAVEWWLPNLFLLLYPLPAMGMLLYAPKATPQPPEDTAPGTDQAPIRART